MEEIIAVFFSRALLFKPPLSEYKLLHKEGMFASLTVWSYCPISTLGTDHMHVMHSLLFAKSFASHLQMHSLLREHTVSGFRR